MVKEERTAIASASVRLTRRCSGGHETQFSCVLSMPFVAPLNAGVRMHESVVHLEIFDVPAF